MKEHFNTVPFLNKRIEKLLAEIDRLKGDNALFVHNNMTLRKLVMKLQHREVLPKWITEHIMFLIKACHPDKHFNNIEANEITKELLDIRKRM